MKKIDTYLKTVRSEENQSLLSVMPQSTNFELLRPYSPHLADLGGFAERYWMDDPASALVKLRVFGEFLVKDIYIRNGFEMYSSDTFMDLLDGYEFRSSVPKVVLDKLHLLRTKGNSAAHQANFQTTREESLLYLKEAHDLSKWLLLSQGRQIPQEQLTWKMVPEVEEDKESLKKQNTKFQKTIEENGELTKALFAKLAAAQKQIQDKDAQLQTASKQGGVAASTLKFDEATTRKRLIDVQLAEAGWDVGINGANTKTVGQEVVVSGQPTKTGFGYIDYVLYSEDGKPLGIVEAKRTSESDTKGKKQAELYADALEKETGVRPIIFLTNGYEISMWNDARGQALRKVYGYYSQESLQYDHFQRTGTADLSTLSADAEIAGRPYQLEAIKRVCERFDVQKKRQALVVQATGTGKTRVSIGLCELLIRAKFAKRILFLCDRKELRKQAKDSFTEFLPGEPSCILKNGNYSTNDRIFVATYPSMMKCFQSYDVGFFDLIIADESHRSIYNRYKDIFKWFDAYQLGLTATPVEFMERNTFSIFGCDDQDPTAQYTYQEAIDNKPPHLSYFEVTSVTSKFQRDGIKWSELSDEQKEQLKLEEDIDDPESVAIEPEDIGSSVYVDSTDRAIIRNLMDNGIKNATKTHVGKSIIFAKKQAHAEKLVELFDEMYPQYGSKFCAVITSNVERADDLITEFKDPKSELYIAVSVDMLDTGIDVPEIVNLVFAKSVKSVAKFWQMIGRGTRLSENLFGPGQHKTKFQIFDHGHNFEFFEMMQKEKEPAPSKGLLELLFESRIVLGKNAITAQNTDALELSKKLILQDLESLPPKSISVMDARKQIDAVKASSDLFAPTTAIAVGKLARLMQNVCTHGNDLAYQFDLFMTRLQVDRLVGSSKVANHVDKITSLVARLPINLPQVAAKAKFITLAKTTGYLSEKATVLELETLRLELRGIMKHIAKGGGGGVSVIPTLGNIEDSDIEVKTITPGFIAETFPAYRQRVQDVLKDIMDSDPVIIKIRNGESISDDELDALAQKVTTQDPTLSIRDITKYEEAGDDISKALLGIVGLSPEKVSEYFSKFLQEHTQLSPNQMKFLDMVQQHIATYGPIEAKQLFKIQPPGMGDNSFGEIFEPEDQKNIVSIIKTINDEVA